MTITEEDVTTIVAVVAFFGSLFGWNFGETVLRLVGLNDDEEDEMSDDRETNSIYDNASSDNLLDAKMRVLELAVGHHAAKSMISDPAHGGNTAAPPATPADIVKTARTFWDFIAVKDADEIEGE